MNQSTLERAFLTRWDQLTRDLDPQPPEPTFQCYFSLERDWVYDFAWIDKLICLDLQGGGWVRGGHSRELGMANDFNKHNAALLLGWRPFLASTSMIDNDPISLVNSILVLLDQPVLSLNAEYSMWIARIKNLTSIGAEVTNNGITLRREKRNAFTLVLSGKEYRTSPHKYLVDGQNEVLNVILRGASTSSTPLPLQKGRASKVQMSLF